MSTLDLSRSWHQAIAKYEALALRERVLVGLTLAACILMLWDLLLSTPLQSSRQEVESGVNNAGAQLTLAVQEQRLLSESTIRDPDKLLREERQQLEAELTVLETELREALDRFVAPQKMPALLAELMRQHEGLQFKRVTRLPSEPLAASISQELLNKSPQADTPVVAGSAEPLPAESDPSLYRHPIELEFEGGYFDVLAYLTTLEQSHWRLNWRSLEYKVQEYPLARVTVRLDTLSRRKEWLGV